MAAIDVGAAAINRNTFVGSGPSPGDTFIAKANAANDTGMITSVEIWANAQMSNVSVAIFTHEGSNVFSTRDSVDIGTVTAGAKQTFTVSLEVQSGDYIGIHWDGGSIEASDSGGSGRWYYNGDAIPCSSLTFTDLSDVYDLSLYGEGATVAVGRHRLDLGHKLIRKKE